MSNYTSNLLCHFVGRSKTTDDERFELLITIIKGNRLIANLSNPDKPESYFQSGYQCEHVGEVFGKCDCVCFCDIPNEALEIHTNKYSKFGMGFEKTFIAEQGAHPVMYVPENYNIYERGDGGKGQSITPRKPEQYFPCLLMLSTQLIPLLEMGSKPDILKKELEATGLFNGLAGFSDVVKNAYFSKNYHPLAFSILQGVGTQMAYIKLYDATLPDDHPDNYYMEREWRSLNNILFTLDNIKTIYLPSDEYKEKFQKEFPDYKGDYFIFEN